MTFVDSQRKYISHFEVHAYRECNARKSGLVNLEAIGVENVFLTKDY